MKPDRPDKPKQPTATPSLMDRRVQRRSFIRISTLIGTGVPLVTTLTPQEARAASSGS